MSVSQTNDLRSPQDSHSEAQNSSNGAFCEVVIDVSAKPGHVGHRLASIGCLSTALDGSTSRQARHWPSGIWPCLICLFSSRLLRCPGALTMPASTICPFLAENPLFPRNRSNCVNRSSANPASVSGSRIQPHALGIGHPVLKRKDAEIA